MTGALRVIGSHHPHRLLIRLSLWPKRQQIFSAASVLWGSLIFASQLAGATAVTIVFR